jgi:1D-myo-inositol 3-kinase
MGYLLPNREHPLNQPDQPTAYYLIGHVAHDVTPEGPRRGGTVSYSGSTAAALGAKVSVLTSAHPDEPVLAGMAGELHLVPSQQSTIFENIYTGDVRKQYLRGCAESLTVAHVPSAWREERPRIVHLAPLAQEVDPQLVNAFPGALTAATPQGWMRRWDANGLVSPQPWEHAERLLPVLNVVVFSEEDIHWNTELEAHYAALANLLVVTRAAKGCTVYQQGLPAFDTPAPHVDVVDATGAGDIFAAIFLTVLHRTDDPRRAAYAATQLASLSVTRTGLESVPTESEIRDVLDHQV